MKEYTFRSCRADSRKIKEEEAKEDEQEGEARRKRKLKKEEEAAVAAVAAKANFSNGSSPNWHKIAKSGASHRSRHFTWTCM